MGKDSSLSVPTKNSFIHNLFPAKPIFFLRSPSISSSVVGFLWSPSDALRWAAGKYGMNYPKIRTSPYSPLSALQGIFKLWPRCRGGNVCGGKGVKNKRVGNISNGGFSAGELIFVAGQVYQWPVHSAGEKNCSSPPETCQEGLIFESGRRLKVSCLFSVEEAYEEEIVQWGIHSCFTPFVVG